MDTLNAPYVESDAEKAARLGGHPDARVNSGFARDGYARDGFDANTGYANGAYANGAYANSYANSAYDINKNVADGVTADWTIKALLGGLTGAERALQGGHHDPTVLAAVNVAAAIVTLEAGLAKALDALKALDQNHAPNRAAVDAINKALAASDGGFASGSGVNRSGFVSGVDRSGFVSGVDRSSYVDRSGYVANTSSVLA